MHSKLFASSKRTTVNQLLMIAIATSVFLLPTHMPASAAGSADETALRNAWALYTQQKYSASADAFETLIRTATPSARLYYYAAAANKSGNRMARAKQLCQYVITNFPNSPEAVSAQKLLADAAPAGAAGTPESLTGLPDNLKGKSLDELMQTEEGRKALKEALARQKGGATGISSATASSSIPNAARSSSASSSSTSDSGQGTSAQDIAKDGPDGISQFTGYRNGWFECSMAAMALLPRGQEILSKMIRPAGGGTYIVRFPNDGIDYTLTPQKIEESRIRDKAMWATLIHCAEMMKLHSDHGFTIEDGLSNLTGKKAEKLFAANTTEQQLTSFIDEAVQKHNPIICEAGDDFGSLDELVEPNETFTITDFDSFSGMITLRNPHADNSRRFRLKTDPEHKKFEQLNGGVVRMHISLFPKYFTEVVRSSI